MPNYDEYETRAAAAAATIAASVQFLRTAGYAARGDGGGGLYGRVASQPTHAGKFRSVDRFLPNGTTDTTNGGWWELNENEPVLDQFGAPRNTNNSCTSMLNDAVTFCEQKGIRELRCLSGSYVFNSKPNDITSTNGLIVSGTGSQSTFLYRNYTEGNGTNFGLLTFKCQPCGATRMSIIGSDGTSGGSGVAVVSTASVIAGYVHTDDLLISTGGTFNAAFAMHGLDNVGGVRTGNVFGSMFFDGAVAGTSLTAAAGIHYYAGNAGLLVINGDASHLSGNCQIHPAACGELNLSYFRRFICSTGQCAGNLTVASTATDGVVHVGKCDGTITNNSTSVRVIHWSTGDIYGSLKFNSPVTTTQLKATAGSGTCVSNAVTINNMAGRITTESLTTPAGSLAQITLNNSLIESNDVVIVTLHGYSGSGGLLEIRTIPGSGTAAIFLMNRSSTSAFNGLFSLHFLVVKAA